MASYSLLTVSNLDRVSLRKRPVSFTFYGPRVVFVPPGVMSKVAMRTIEEYALNGTTISDNPANNRVMSVKFCTKVIYRVIDELNELDAESIEGPATKRRRVD